MQHAHNLHEKRHFLLHAECTVLFRSQNVVQKLLGSIRARMNYDQAIEELEGLTLELYKKAKMFINLQVFLKIEN